MFRQLFAKLNYWAAKKEVDPNDPTGHIELELKNFDPISLTRIDIAKSCKDYMFLAYPNIVEFTLVLKRMQLQDYSLFKIPNDYTSTQQRNVSVDHFFYNSAGVRVDIVNSIQEFLKAFSDLFNLYTRHLKKETIGISGYNSRIVYAHLQQSSIILKTLRKYY